MTSRYRGEKAVPFSLKGMGITPIVERSVVSGIDVPLLSFPRFHGFRQTNRTSWFAILLCLSLSLAMQRLPRRRVVHAGTGSRCYVSTGTHQQFHLTLVYVPGSLALE